MYWKLFYSPISIIVPSTVSPPPSLYNYIRTIINTHIYYLCILYIEALYLQTTDFATSATLPHIFSIHKNYYTTILQNIIILHPHRSAFSDTQTGPGGATGLYIFIYSKYVYFRMYIYSTQWTNLLNSQKPTLTYPICYPVYTCI